MWLYLIINTLIFGRIAFSNLIIRREDLFIKHELFGWPKIITILMIDDLISIFAFACYLFSFIPIILTADSIFRGIIIAIIMQMLANHLIWGTLTGIAESYMFRKTYPDTWKRMKESRKN